MGTGPALKNSTSAAELIRCPKCGYDQEQRPDCKKCGIVFSKYLALYPSAKSAESLATMDFGLPEPGDSDLRVELLELQAKVKTLQARFAEIEFERAERNQLRSDLKGLERQLQENAARIFGRLEKCERRLDNPQASQLHQEAFDFEIPAIYDRLEQLEDKLGGLELSCHSIADIREKQDSGLSRLSDIESHIADLRREIAEIRDAAKAQEPRTPIEEDVRAIRKSLDDFRQLLSRNP